MRYSELFESASINEEVFASMAVAYHRTRSLENTNAIGQSGFRTGAGMTYGKGIYLTYDFDDQQDERMKNLYGPYVIRCKVNLNDFVIFDSNIAERVYGNASLENQLASFGIKPGGRDEYAYLRAFIGIILRRHRNIIFSRPPHITAPVAVKFANWLFRTDRLSDIKRRIRGLVFTGSQDGRVIVAYDPSAVIPFAWAEVSDVTETKQTVQWNKITAPPVQTPKAGLGHLI